MTKNYIIFTQIPLVVNPYSVIFGSKPFIENYQWKPKCGTVFTVIDKRTGKVVVQTKGDPFFAFHHVNAYEENDKIILDVIGYPDASAIWKFGTKEQTPPSKETAFASAKLLRFTISLPDGILTSKAITEAFSELPRINDAYEGKAYRFAYTSDIRDRANPEDQRPLYKIDTQTGAIKTWSEKEGIPNEPVFIPAPNALEEDDGVILTVITKPKTSFFVILDAKSFKEIARAEVPHRIPMTLHGIYKKT